MRLQLNATALLVILLAGCNSNSDTESGVSDTNSPEPILETSYLFHNGVIHTVNPSQPSAEAVVVSGNKIVYVGNKVGADDFINTGTEVVDLQGKMLLPGFFSSHEHLNASLWMSAGLDLDESTTLYLYPDYSLSHLSSKEAVFTALEAFAAANRELPFIHGIGWEAGQFNYELPTATELEALDLRDAQGQQRPILLQDGTVHDALLNQTALDIVQQADPSALDDPIPGISYWVRDDQDNLTGLAREVAWMKAYRVLSDWDLHSEQFLEASASFSYGMAASYGLTGFINQGLISPSVLDFESAKADNQKMMSILQKMDEAGELKLRSFNNFFYKNPLADPIETVEYIAKTNEIYNSDRVNMLGLKIHPEGIIFGLSAEMTAPYEAIEGLIPENYYGHANVDRDLMKTLYLEANRRDLTVHTHVEGDATTNSVLDAISNSQKVLGKVVPNSLGHTTTVLPSDLQRIADLQIQTNVTPGWATNWLGSYDLALMTLGKERADNHWMQLRRLVDLNVPVSFSADIPSSELHHLSPLFQIQAAMTRKEPGISDAVEFDQPHGYLTLEESLMAVTINGAKQAGMQDKLGSIEVGKYADLVVLAQDLNQVEIDQIHTIPVVATMMDGQYTYQAE